MSAQPVILGLNALFLTPAALLCIAALAMGGKLLASLLDPHGRAQHR